MRIRTQGVVTATVLAFTGACAGAPAQTQTPDTPSAELAALRARQIEQTQRIAELEARLALLEADARDVRDSQQITLTAGESAQTASSEPTKVTVARRDQAPFASDDETVDADDGKRPTLRLYGADHASAPRRAAVDLTPVPRVTERLPVVPLPQQRVAKTVRTAPAARPERAIDEYRKGLRLLHQRQFDDALATFSAFVAEHPVHELVPSALYWRGEARYAKRDYSGARGEFETLLTRFPAADRAPDALLKLGLSLRKLGARARANDAFERLRTEYPNSQAAQAAAREGST